MSSDIATGIPCPYCQSEFSGVINSRSSSAKKTRYRRRKCQGCGKAFTTWEMTAPRVEDVIHPRLHKIKGMLQEALQDLETSFALNKQENIDV